MGDQEPLYDVLAVVERMQQLGFGVSEGEVHCFAYLACLGWVHEGHAPETWGYGFTALNTARPFASAFAFVIRDWRLSGLLRRAGEVVQLADRGKIVLQSLRASALFANRTGYLEASCDVSMAITIPTALSALTMEPQLAGAAALGSQRILFDEFGLGIAMNEMTSLAELLPRDASLLARMTLWVSYWAARKERADRDFQANA